MASAGARPSESTASRARVLPPFPGRVSGSRPIRPVVVLPLKLFASTISQSQAGYWVVCENCGTGFQAQRSTARTCSGRCRRAVYERRHGSE